MKPKHTPGPWSTLDRHIEIGKIDRIGVGPIDYEVCRVNCYGDNSLENARLIATSPELLSWAKAFLILLEGMAVSSTINKNEQFFAHTTLSKMINDLKRTIAKATGDCK